MKQSLMILGRQPALGIAELESLYGAEALQPAGANAVIIDVSPEDVNINRLGGTIKIAKLLTKINSADWQKITEYLTEHVPKHTCCIGPGKLNFGISAYDLKVKQKDIEKTALSVKKVVRASDKRPFRAILPKKGCELNSAQVIHGELIGSPLGMELLLVNNGDVTLLAQTTQVQDIDAYAARDQARPKRDAKVGMLPPKLAQIIVNLAGRHVIPEDAKLVEEQKTRRACVLDPFCGTGVILQEALLMGYGAFGTDIDLRMVQYAQENIEWLQSRFSTAGDCHITVGDATSFDWKNAFDIVACETYLGRPFSRTPDHTTLKKVMQDVDTIHKKFLENVAKQTEKGLRLCLAVPAWKKHTTKSTSGVGGSADKQAGAADEFWHLKTLDSLEKLGYTRLSFKHARNEDLIYHREGQIVGRELVVLVRK